MFGRALRNPKLMSLPVRQSAQVRRLNLHEFQSLEIMKDFGVATPQGIPADTCRGQGRLQQDPRRPWCVQQLQYN